MRLLQDSPSPSLETETFLGATFLKIFAWLMVMIKDEARELAV
jgi:hypothetical protein